MLMRVEKNKERTGELKLDKTFYMLDSNRGKPRSILQLNMHVHLQIM